MKREIMICDICGGEYSHRDTIKPDGSGGFIDLRRKYPTCIDALFKDSSSFSFFSKESENEDKIIHYDLCIDCSMKISRYIRSLWWDSQQKHSL